MPPPPNKKRNEFFVDTKKICFLCVKENPTPVVNLEDNTSEAQDGKQISHLPIVELEYEEKMQKKEEHEYGEKLNMRRIFRHLKLNPGKLFRKEFTGSLFASKELLNNITNWKVLLCQDCFSFATGLSEMCLELELLQMKLDHSVQIFQGIIDDSEKSLETLRGKLTNPLELFHRAIADLLRNGVKVKCTSRLKKSTPRVKLSKMQMYGTKSSCTISEALLMPPEPTNLLLPNFHSNNDQSGPIMSTLSTQAEKIRYKRAQHPNNETLTCNSCGMKLVSKAEWIRHTRLYCSFRRTNTTSSQGRSIVKLENTPAQANIPVVPVPTSAPTRFKCPLCTVTFSNAHNLERHQMTQHSFANVSLTCNTCGAKFSSKTEWIRHTNLNCSYRRTNTTSSQLVRSNNNTIEGTMMNPDDSVPTGPPPVVSVPRGRRRELGWPGKHKCADCGTSFSHGSSLGRHKAKYCPKTLAKNPVIPQPASSLMAGATATFTCEASTSVTQPSKRVVTSSTLSPVLSSRKCGFCEKMFSSSCVRRRHERQHCPQAKTETAASVEGGHEQSYNIYLEGDGEEHEEEVYSGSYANTKIEVLDMNPVQFSYTREVEGMEDLNFVNSMSMECSEEVNYSVPPVDNEMDTILPDAGEFGDPLS